MTATLIGLLDSPFVRRVAISMLALGFPFEHRPISVFRGFDAFQGINPVVKAPTLIASDGTVLMDSTLILQYVEAVSSPSSLLPSDSQALLRSLRLVGLSLAGCEKTAQIVYERGLRPPDKQHQPWIDRLTTQLQAAFGELEREVANQSFDLSSTRSLGQAGISIAVAWYFAHQMLPEILSATSHPSLAALSTSAESLPEFSAAPHGEGTVAWRDRP